MAGCHASLPPFYVRERGGREGREGGEGGREERLRGWEGVSDQEEGLEGSAAIKRGVTKHASETG